MNTEVNSYLVPIALKTSAQLLNQPNCGLDPEVSIVSASFTINHLHEDGNYGEALKLIRQLSDDIIRRSDYDPFDLALFSTQLAELTGLQPANVTVDPNQPDPDLLFVVGLPHIAWIDVYSHLSERADIGPLFSASVINHIGQRVNDFLNDSAPQSIHRLSVEQVSDLKNFYLQNLSFVHGGKTLELIVDLIPNSFKNIGILAQIFPKARFVAVNFPAEELVLSYYTTIDGFNSRHANATISELIAYVFDYAVIIDNWRRLLSSRFSSITYCRSSQSIHDLVTAILETDSKSFASSVERSSQVTTLLEAYPELQAELLESNDDILQINNLLFPLH